MGDRTFSAEDVIRIYQDFLTESEMDTVDDFFTNLPEDLQLTGLIRLVDLFDDLVPLLARLGPVAAVFGTLAIALLNQVIRQVAGLSMFLSSEIEKRSVDA